MKRMKKVAGLFLAVCLMVSCFSMMALAANRIMFEDPSTKVGETLRLKGVLEADSAIEDRKIVMTYDTEKLKFQSGDSVSETGAGQLTYEVKGQQSANRVEFFMNFLVLKEGTAKVEVSSYEVYNTANAKLDLQRGNSTITIAAGEAPVVPVDGPTANTDGELRVEVDGVSYTFSSAFADSDIPEGYAKTTMEYDGKEQTVVWNEAVNIYLGYLVDAENNGAFFMYQSEDATFAPFKQIDISESTTITLLSNTSGVSLPSQYVEKTVTVDGIEFPAWQDADEPELCLLYAKNNQGENSLYQYDTVEGTYQRFSVPDEKNVQEDEKGSLLDNLGENADILILAIGICVVIFLILIIVLSVKLYNRNAELDELYDEYGIDLDDEDDADSEEDDMFIRIDDMTDEDVVLEKEEDTDDIAIVPLDILEEAPAEKQPAMEELFAPAEEVAVTEEKEEDVFEPIAKQESRMTTAREDLDAIAKAVLDTEDDEDTVFEDDDEDDFEVDFIDLDD
ncbi:MAG: hypothetical protein UHS49_00585 [Faecalimonas sp.]|nr:hypothetical protein [Faecalimonas sp.]